METNWLAILVALPVNLLICCCIFLDLKELYEQKKRFRERIKNLKRDLLYINLTKEELGMLRAISKKENCNSPAEYIRKCIKELNKESSLEDEVV